MRSWGPLLPSCRLKAVDEGFASGAVSLCPGEETLSLDARTIRATPKPEGGPWAALRVTMGEWY